MPLDDRQTLRNNNVFVLGASAEKINDGFIKPNLLQGNSSFVVHDVTGDLLASTGRALETMGYEIRILDLTRLRNCNLYNPFCYLRTEEDVLLLTKTLIQNTNPKTDSKNVSDYTSQCQKAEEHLLLSLIFYMLEMHEPEDCSFSAILQFLKSTSDEEGNGMFTTMLQALDVCFRKLEKKDPKHNAVCSYNAFRATFPGTSGIGVLHSLMVRLQIFNIPKVKALTSADTLDLISLGEKPVALFCIPNQDISELNILANFLYTQLFSILEHKWRKHSQHVQFFFTDIKTIGKLYDFPSKLSTMRLCKVSCSVIVQSIAALKEIYGENWEVIAGYCDSFLYFGIDEENADPLDLEYINKLCSYAAVRDIRYTSVFWRMLRFSHCRRGKYRFTPEMLLDLDEEGCVLFVRGADFIYDELYPYLTHPNNIIPGKGR